MSSIYSHPSFNNSYLVYQSDLEEEEGDTAENYLVDESTYTSCSFCKKKDHSQENCNYKISLGIQLHLKGLEVREFDIEMNCNGKSVSDWIYSLSMLHLQVLSLKINLQSYSSMLNRSGFITFEQSILFNRANYILSLNYYYYLKPTFSTLQKKMNFQIGLLKSNDSTIFECPICIEKSIPIKEKIQFNCSHCICNSCFQNYVDQLKENSKATCSLCRKIVTEIHVVHEDYLYYLEKKYNLDY
jgi:hypothetical protein